MTDESRKFVLAVATSHDLEVTRFSRFFWHGNSDTPRILSADVGYEGWLFMLFYVFCVSKVEFYYSRPSRLSLHVQLHSTDCLRRQESIQRQRAWSRLGYHDCDLFICVQDSTERNLADLVYVSDQIIIMGYPAAGLEGLVPHTCV